MKYNNEKLAEAVKSSKSWGQVYRTLTGKTGNNGAMETHFKNRAVKAGVDYSHFTRIANAKKAVVETPVVEAPVVPAAA